MESVISMSDQGQLIWMWLSVRKMGLCSPSFRQSCFCQDMCYSLYIWRNSIVKPTGLWYHKHIKKFAERCIYKVGGMNG